MARIYITGGTGCIGASTVQHLISNHCGEDDRILLATRGNQTDSLKLWLDDQLDDLIQSGRIEFAKVDLQQADQIESSLESFDPTHIIHLGALQSPDCAADPQRGLQVNLAGTLALFESATKRKSRLQRFVFASSAAVYGKRSTYPGNTVSEDVVLAPPNLYGVWKVAGEHLAALFQQQTKVPTVCLRLNTTYGPGRDRGLTSAPTRIMKAVAFGAVRETAIRCEMPYSGRENYHYVEDVGAHFAGCCMMPFDGFAALNIKGQTIPVDDFLQRIQDVANDLGIGQYCDCEVAKDAVANLFVCDLDDAKVENCFPGLPRTELAVGIRQTLEQFLSLARNGTLDSCDFDG